MNEFELKFQIPAERLAAVEAALRRGAVQRTKLRARYFDTAGEALKEQGLVLRLRQEGRAWIQTAKGRGRNAFDRLEHNVAVADGADTVPDASLHEGHPVGQLLHDALANAQEELQPVFETDVTRLARVVEAAGASVEIALDRGQIRADGRMVPVQEIEFELKRGDPAAVVELAQRWSQEHGLWLDPLSKAAAGWRVARGVTEPPPVMARALKPARDDANALAAAMLDSALEQVLGNAREIAAGAFADEHVHQLRVGLRRLRTVLRELRGLRALEGLDPEVEPALRDAFGVLGQHRDLSTLLPRLQQEIAAAGGRLAPWQPELPDLQAAVRDAPLQSALLQLIALVQVLGHTDDPAPQSLKEVRKLVASRLRKLQRGLVRDGKRFDELEGTQRHRVRKRLKRLRYLSELARPLFAGRAVDRFVAALKDLQDALGEYQDAAAGRALFTQRVADDPAAWFGAGWLAAQEAQWARKCAKACRETAAKAQPFWD